MPLFRRNSRVTINPKKFSDNLSSTPVNIAGDSTSTIARFDNAVPIPSNADKISEELDTIVSEDIFVCGHPSITTGRIIKFFTGEPQNVDAGDPESAGNSGGDCEFSPEGALAGRDCVISYMFAHIVPRRRINGGFRKTSPIPSSEIPYSPPIGTIEPEDADLPFQVMFVEQDEINNELIKLSSARIQHTNVSAGVSVIRNEILDIDTWYNGRFENFNLGNNVSVGSSNDTEINWEPGERYNWTHGVINFTSNIASEWTGETCIVSGGYLDTSECEDTVKVVCTSELVEVDCPSTSSQPSSATIGTSGTSGTPGITGTPGTTGTSGTSGSPDPCFTNVSTCKSVIVPFDPEECGVWVPTLIPDPESVITYDGELTGEDSVIKETVNGKEVKAVYSEDSISLIAWKFFVYSIGTDDDPYRDIHSGTDFKDTDAVISGPVKINYFEKKYGKAKYISKMKQMTEGDGISIGENSRGNLVIAKK